ncbi:MAG TPA: LEA type 2 family protein [Halobacteria archaeon]|nr:LEA type 2 family protein [Halobacteria archaeon]
MAKGTWIVIGIIVALVVIGGVLWYVNQETLQNCEVSVVDVRMGSIGIKSATLDVVFEINNPSDSTAYLDEIEYEVYINDVNVGDGDVEQQISIPAHQTKRIDSKFVLEYADVGSAIANAVRTEQAEYYVEGTASFGNTKVPIKFVA